MTDLLEVWPGVPYPLGASCDPRGVNFALYSEGATAVELVLFDSDDPGQQTHSFPLLDVTNHVWHGYVPHLSAGQLYGYRVTGPWDPSKGQRYNAKKLLVDPYAKAISGKPDWKEPLHGSTFTAAGVESRNEGDSGRGAPKSVVVADDFDWAGERRPQVLWRKSVIYEVHVKGFTARHPRVPEEQRGTYLGLAHPGVIGHLTSLGVTSVQLLPVHEAASEGFILEKGLSNFWGYNTLGFFAPDQRFSSSGVRGEQVREFKTMVKALHNAGIEVLLDVVYNHTCEGNERGPTLSFRGLDAPAFYWADPTNPGRHLDFTGCGNSLNLRHPQVLKLVLDSLRYWVTEMHVDGFRFDLATTLGRRGNGEFDPSGPFFQAIHQDPVLSRVKLIAEPWDVGLGGYRVGQFPLQWAEWNDKYRESIRRFWRGDERQAGEIGYRLTGSSDLFKVSGRRPTASINYVACHDGFTLRDLVSYNQKHNELNGEENRDGAGENHSYNCGVEGETDDPLVLGLRDRQARNLLATLFLSVGTPMLCAGDELGRTQWGNNNAWCQDNALSWVDWELDEARNNFLAFAKACLKVRRDHPVLQRRNFFLGSTLDDSQFHDLAWVRPDGKEMQPADWAQPHSRCLGWFLGGDAIGARGPDGRKVVGQSLLLYVNAGSEAVELVLPDKAQGDGYEVVLETARDNRVTRSFFPGERLSLAGRSLMVMQQLSKAV